MQRVLSTHLFINHTLHPGLLEIASRGGADAVEIFAARQHFDYTNRATVSELGEWFRSTELKPWSLHGPIFPDREMGRTGAPAINVVHPEKARRIDGMDELKRALETAEYIPFKYMVVHLGDNTDGWSQRTMEYASTALEHLGAFAAPLGVHLIIENLMSAATTPEHLKLILDMAHLGNISICLDLGHAHMTVGVAQAIESIGARTPSIHVHDNNGLKDEHLWPGDGAIDWQAAMTPLLARDPQPAIVLELSHGLAKDLNAVPDRVKKSFDFLNQYAPAVK